MTGRTRVLLALGCVVGLLAVASVLPAADPRLDNPASGGAGAGGGDPIAGDWESIVDSPGEATSTSTETPAETPGDGSASPGDPEITIDGALEPGNTVEIRVDDRDPFGSMVVHVDGRRVGEISGFGGVDARVPFAEAMTVTVPEEGLSRTVPVATRATIDDEDPAVPGRQMTVEVRVGDTAVPDATLARNGTVVARTDGSGHATVELPDEAGPISLRAERDPVAGERTMEVDRPSVRFTSPLLFPRMPAPVQVSAGGEPVPGATVTVSGGGNATTGASGDAQVGLPVADRATARVSLGAETATATAEHLYLRFATVVVLLPGFVIGGVWTYLRFVPRRHQIHRRGTVELFVVLADALGGLADLFRMPRVSLGLPDLSIPRPGLPRLPALSWPSVSVSWPSMSVSWPGFGGLGGLVGLFGGGSSGSIGNPLPSIGSLFGDDDDDPDASDDSDASDDAATPAGGADATAEQAAPGPRGPRAEIRAAWHAFVDRLGVEDRESAAPGALARRAVATGFPAEPVRTLVGTFRAVEYGGREPTAERRATARAASEELGTHDSDEPETGGDE